MNGLNLFSSVGMCDNALQGVHHQKLMDNAEAKTIQRTSEAT